MIHATRNQLANVGNPFQTDEKKVLCVCSAGLLRSPTLANVIHEWFGHNTRAVGSCKEFALIPISQALIHWADEIVFVNQEAHDSLEQDEIDEINTLMIHVIVLDIPDCFDWGDDQLVEECKNQYEAYWRD